MHFVEKEPKQKREDFVKKSSDVPGLFALKLNFVMNRSVLSESNLILPWTTLPLAISIKRRR